MTRSRCQPILIRNTPEPATIERLHLGSGMFSEAWLTGLIHNNPGLLPVQAIEPGFRPIIAVAREVPCISGLIDNLFVTGAGELVLVEAKLWRNPQIRREVVAQALDYVASLTTLDYAGLEKAIAVTADAAAGFRLYDLIADQPDALSEPDFVDAVSLNLRRGRILIIVLGDGIRTETEALVSLLQSHAGAHFTFALVEIALWRHIDSGDIIAVPDVLTKTVMIERGVVRIEDGRPHIQPVPAIVQAKAKGQSLSDVAFYEHIASIDPALPTEIRRFLDLVAPLRVEAEVGTTLKLRLTRPSDGKRVSLGYVARNGLFWTDPLIGQAPLVAIERYHQALADLFGGVVSPSGNLTTNGKSAPPITSLLPEHASAWIEEIRRFLAEIACAEAEA